MSLGVFLRILAMLSSSRLF